MDSWVLRALIREVMHTFIVYLDDDDHSDDNDEHRDADHDDKNILRDDNKSE